MHTHCCLLRLSLLTAVLTGGACDTVTDPPTHAPGTEGIPTRSSSVLSPTHTAASTTTTSGTATAAGTSTAASTTTATTATATATATTATATITNTAVRTEFWPDAYNPSVEPTPADGHHNTGAMCLDCHDTKRVWLYGGTVYTAEGRPARVEVGISDGRKFFSAYSGANGNIWMDRNGASLNWDTAEIRIRNSNGERIMHGVGHGNCNFCHPANHRIIAP